jgi:23S rRNA (cytidine1920-2'-O)/16S rRNA (cytidine1409-2'-O)-methyltransferase
VGGPKKKLAISKQRLDALLVRRGLAQSRERAQALILSGVVMVDGKPAQKAGTQVADDVEVAVQQPDHPYVGRGGVKLAHALDTFGITVHGRAALDIGASTGGFTDVLLRRGATRVIAFDVGHGQLDWGLRNDSRVVVIERANARSLEPSDLPELVDIVTIDVSFISLRHIFPRVPPLLRPGADVVALVKPQFEAGRAEVGKKGVVRDATVQHRVVEEAGRSAAEVGLVRVAMSESPITGDTGNREFFLHLRGTH